MVYGNFIGIRVFYGNSACFSAHFPHSVPFFVQEQKNKNFLFTIEHLFGIIALAISNICSFIYQGDEYCANNFTFGS